MPRVRWSNREKLMGIRGEDSSFTTKPLCGLQYTDLEKWRGVDDKGRGERVAMSAVLPGSKIT